MTRPVTLFTGQWADLPLGDLCRKAAVRVRRPGIGLWGYHFDVTRGVDDPTYCRKRREMLEAHGLGVWAISNHLVGQSVADVVDNRHRNIISPHVLGDGDPDGVRSRAAEEMKRTARVAANMGLEVVNGFTGSPSGHSSTHSHPRVPRRSSTVSRSSQSYGFSVVRDGLQFGLPAGEVGAWETG